MTWFLGLLNIVQVLLFVGVLAGMLSMLRFPAVRAIFKRNVLSYFSGVIGYLFIIVFVVVGAFLAFNTSFFANNQANLDQLSDKYPILLLFLVPTITMSVWADERKMGTDELLFTLPASDLQVLMGKYLSVMAIYTIALVFSLTHLIVLAVIGDPDWGLLVSTYFGYWLSGAALLSAGMFASLLTNSGTVAFILGSVICAVPVFVGYLAPSSEFVQGLSLAGRLRDFNMGIIPLSSIAYFVSLTLFMLYLNLVFISRRHWIASQQTNMGFQFAVRTVAVVAVLIGANVLASHATYRGDLTSERLYTLSPATRKLFDKISDGRPVTIQAFISSQVPREYVASRKQLIGLLRQYDQLGGRRVEVRYINVTPYSEETDEAKKYGISPKRVRSERDGRSVNQDVYMGAVIISSYDEVVIPFFGAGSLIEYELTRTIRTVSKERRLTVGILSPDNISLFGDQSGRRPDWEIVGELKKQYDVKKITANAPIEMKRRLFSLSPKIIGELAHSEASDALVAAFAEKKIKLTSLSAVDVVEKKKEWLISDVDRDRKFTVVKEEKTLTVYEHKYNVLLVVLPSLLSSSELNHLIDYVEKGHPALIFDDPCPQMFANLGGFNTPMADPFSPKLESTEQYLFALFPLLRKELDEPATSEQLVESFAKNNIRLTPGSPIEVVEPNKKWLITDEFWGRKYTVIRKGQVLDVLETRPPFTKDRKYEPTGLWRALGIASAHDKVAWDEFNPHHEFSTEPKEFLFVKSRDEIPTAFNPDHEVTSGLQELIAFYSGVVVDDSNGAFHFEPLLQTGPVSGILGWDEVLIHGFGNFTFNRMRQPERPQIARINRDPERRKNEFKYTLAAHITSDDKEKRNVIYVADADMITDLLFILRRDAEVQRQVGQAPLIFDNVTFVLNAVDYLAGDSSFIALRKRRAESRTLKKVEEATARFVDEQTAEQKKARDEAQDRLDEANARLKKKQKSLQENKDLDETTKAFLLIQAQLDEANRVHFDREAIDRETREKIDKIKDKTQRQIHSTEVMIRWVAVATPPIPAILLGIVMLAIRITNETRSVKSDRLVRR